jgi:hypothetical protein
MARGGLMRTVDRLRIAAHPDTVWPHATDVEHWPAILPHYRWVTRLEGPAGGDGVVEMAAWRPFGGPLNWPTWWASRIWVDAERREVRYRHLAGITAGMDVRWTVAASPDGGCDVTIIHSWKGPRWPLIGGLAASLVIGPVFIHGIASRTLAGIARVAEASQ